MRPVYFYQLGGINFYTRRTFIEGLRTACHGLCLQEFYCGGMWFFVVAAVFWKLCLRTDFVFSFSACRSGGMSLLCLSKICSCEVYRAGCLYVYIVGLRKVVE